MAAHTHQDKPIHLAADHAGFALKERVKEWLEASGKEIIDHGAHQHDALDDFPDFIGKAAQAVGKAPETNVALIFGGSGQGEAMAANRVPGVRATVYYGGDSKIITLSREHNDANVLSVGARFVDFALCKKIVTAWLQTEFDNSEKRIRRNRKLEHIS